MISRNYQLLSELITAGQSVLVLGPRGTGKTYYLSQSLLNSSNKVQIDLLDELIFQRYLKEPNLLKNEIEAVLRTKTERATVFIDEVQRLPALLNTVHLLLERHKGRITFVLSGSSARKLKRADANLLAGRALKVDFFPLGVDEVNYQDNESKLLQYGSLPFAFTAANPLICRKYLQTYVAVYLQEEIQREAQLRNLEGFSRFLDLAAADNGQPLNFSRIARNAGLSDVTVKDYYAILEDTLLAYRIPAWTYSARKKMLQAAKFYLFDNGVINALLGELNTELRPTTFRFGKLFENFVITQLLQHRAKNDLAVNFYHYRTESGTEIDLILQKNSYSQPVAVEIKSGTAPQPKDVSQLLKFGREYPSSHRVVICRTPVRYEVDSIKFLPLAEGINETVELAVQA